MHESGHDSLHYFLYCLFVASEEALWHQVQDSAALHHVVSHSSDKAVPQECEAEQLDCEEAEKHDLSYLFVICLEIVIGRLKDLGESIYDS